MIQNILITSAGRRVGLVKNFQNTLKRFNLNGKVYTTDMNPKLSSACNLSDGYIQVPRVTDKNYLKLLKSFCLKKNISIVIPTIDTELHILAKVKDDFMKDNIFLAISSTEICDTFYLKTSTESFFIKNGFNIPKSINNIKTITKYPTFAKLNNSSCSIGAQIVYTSKLVEYLSMDKNYIFQEFINGVEFTVDVFIDSKENVISIVPRERLKVRAGEVSKARTVKDLVIIEEIKKVCKKLEGAYGCLTIQLFRTDENKIVFIEINPRFGGGYPLSYKAGADFAEFLIKDYLGQKLAYTETWQDNILMLRYDAEVFL